MGIDNESPRGRQDLPQTKELMSLRRPPLPTNIDTTEAAPVHQPAPPLTRQVEQQQLQQDPTQQREMISTGELRRRISDTGELTPITPDQEASAARILSLAGETDQRLLENPGFVEAADRFFSVMRPHMAGNEEEKDRSAAHAAIIAAKNDVNLRGEVNRQRDNARMALEKMTLARTEAETDELTGAYNRRGFHRRLGETLLFGNEPGVLAEFDLNLLKQLNDNFGEAAGDDMIRLAVEGLQAGIRGTDVVGRAGGDEILVLLRGVTAEQVRKILARQIDPQLEARGIPQLPGQSISLGGGYMEFHPRNFQGLSDEEFNAKVKDMLLRVMAAMKEAKGLSKRPESVTHRAYTDANTPEAQARYEQLKQDRTITVTFDR